MRKIVIKTEDGETYTMPSKWTKAEEIKDILNTAKETAWIEVEGLVIKAGTISTVLVTNEGEEWHETV